MDIALTYFCNAGKSILDGLQIFTNWVLVVLFGLYPMGKFYPGITQSRLEKEFTLTWADEFEYGDDWQYDDWDGPFYNSWHGHWQNGSGEYFYSPNNKHQTLSMKDGALHIGFEYAPEGMGGSDYVGWYTDTIDLRRTYKQCYGYFEIRAILPRVFGGWGAFWLYDTHVSGTYPPAGVVGASDGAEIDIFEAPYSYAYWYKKADNGTYLAHPFSYWQNTVNHTVHYDGYRDYHKAYGEQVFGGWDLYNSYHTYGLEWNPNEYIFYIDGKETSRMTDPELICHIPLWPILCIATGSWAGDEANNPTDPDDPNYPTDYIIDYLRIYQYKEIPEQTNFE
ncbi:MAG: glycoside hydrolase family 16 protein [Oscillospiraceae bacterium]|jgi:hypothetical protein|nr:glycoside hydrolase family 16 protein [Oscillospiraceae bacterium]